MLRKEVKHEQKLFKRAKDDGQHCNQNVEVNVTVNEKQDDCLTGAFKACFGAGKKATTS